MLEKKLSMKEIVDKKILKILSLINNNNNYHTPSSKKHENLKKDLKEIIKKNHVKDDIYQILKKIKVRLPFYNMGGNINSLNLFELDELIIFSIYSKIIIKNIKFADLGANIGLHTIVASKLGAKVTAYEPDLEHIKQLNKNLKINKIKANVIRKAIFTKKTNIKFTKVVNNLTSSFIGNAKVPYGPIKITKVKTEIFSDVLKKNDILKVDVEGIEDKLVKSIKKNDLINKFLILEVGTRNNAKIIFSHLRKFNNIVLLSQKTQWSKVKKIDQMPESYKDGSLIIFEKNFLKKKKTSFFKNVD